MQERMTLCNMAAELGAQTGLIASDEVTFEFLKLEEKTVWESDPGAALLAHHRFKAESLAPQVAAPHSPANAREAAAFKEVQLNMAYLGACTGAKLEDLRMAARVLKNRKSRLKLVVAPASVRDREAAEKEGVLKVLADAGAEFIASSCGICAGYGAGLPDDCVAISSTARNFKGRMGSPKSQVYLGSPYTVAASAVAGRIADPRELLA
jgi:3-isopropylmalate/(R)-2-methylmalate dehydratase large subunit